MKNVSVAEFVKGIDAGRYGDRMLDYRNSKESISDIIEDIASGILSEKFDTLNDYILENATSIGAYVKEYGWNTFDNDICNAGLYCESEDIISDIEDHLVDCLKLCAYSYLRFDLKEASIPKKMFDEVMDTIEGIPDNMWEIKETIDKYYEGEE